MIKRMLALLCGLLVLTGCAAKKPAIELPEPEGTLSVWCLEGGSLLLCGGEALLLDCGSGITPQILSGLGVEQLSGIILTGCGEAQTGALAEILAACPAQVLSPAELEDTDSEIPSDGTRLLVGSAMVTILRDRPGSAAVAVRVDFGSTGILFAGPMTPPEQQTLLDIHGPQELLKADVLCLNAGLSLTQELAEAVSPNFCVIAGEASRELMTRTAQAGALNFIVNKDSPVVLESDGKTIQAQWDLNISDPVAS